LVALGVDLEEELLARGGLELRRDLLRSGAVCKNDARRS